VLTVSGFSFGYNTQAHAIGCLSGGGDGHMAHHGVLGAIGGCIAGHQYNKHQKLQKQQAAQQQTQDASQPADVHTSQ
jgi:uncharacterized membrane protein YebE (DUF533 family)